MNKFIYRHKFVLGAAIIAFIFVFFFVPITPGGVAPPCYPGGPDLLCNLVAPQTFFQVVKDNQHIVSVDWSPVVIVYLFVFVAAFGELKLLAYAIQPQKQTKIRGVVVKKILALAAFIVVFLISIHIINLIFSFFGYSLSGVTDFFQ